MSRSERAYELRGEGHDWNLIGRVVGLASALAAKHGAKRHAIRNRLPWPVGGGEQPPLPPKPRSRGTAGERIYAMRRETGLPYRAIADRLGLNPTTAHILPRKYAFQMGLPWPLPTLLDLQAKELGRRAYHLRPSLSWDQIGKIIGESGTRAQTLAERFAEQAGLQEPPKPEMAGRLPYTLRAAGLPWTAVSDRSGYAFRNHAINAACRWAEAHGLPWPIVPPQTVVSTVGLDTKPQQLPLELGRGREAYQRNLQGETWTSIVEAMGSSYDYIQGLARGYARSEGLPWPVKVTPIPDSQGLGERVYGLRCGGDTWETISNMLGRGRTALNNHGRTYAAANGKPWPVQFVVLGQGVEGPTLVRGPSHRHIAKAEVRRGDGLWMVTEQSWLEFRTTAS